MKTNQTTEKLSALSAKRSGVLEALERIESIVNSKRMVPFDSSTIDQARLNLEDCIARHVLDESTLENIAQARKELTDAEQALVTSCAANETTSLELAGLNRRLSTVKQEANALETSITATQIKWLEDELFNAEEEYTKHAKEVKNYFLRVMACHSSIQRRGGAVNFMAPTSAEIMLPVIGISSLQCAGPNGASAWGSGLFAEKRPVSNFGSVNIELELNDATNPTTKPSLLSAIGQRIKTLK